MVKVWNYSWGLGVTDTMSVGKELCRSLWELEKQMGEYFDSQMDSVGMNIAVRELVQRYLMTKMGEKHSTLTGDKYVQNLLKEELFKTLDEKLFLMKLQWDGKGSSIIKTVRGVLRPAFRMAVDDDVLNKNPFGFERAL